LSALRDQVPVGPEESESLRYLTDGEQLFMITSDREKILRAMERQFVLSLGIGSLVRELTGAVERVTGGAQGSGTGVLRRLAEKRSGSA
jgi:hypothetical protein